MNLHSGAYVLRLCALSVYAIPHFCIFVTVAMYVSCSVIFTKYHKHMLLFFCCKYFAVSMYEYNCAMISTVHPLPTGIYIVCIYMYMYAHRYIHCMFAHFLCTAGYP